MPLKSYATQMAISDAEQIFVTESSWEHNIVLPVDEVCPDLLTRSFASATKALLEKAADLAVALDWSTIRSHIYRRSTGLVLVTRLAVL